MHKITNCGNVTEAVFFLSGTTPTETTEIATTEATSSTTGIKLMEHCFFLPGIVNLSLK